MNFFKWLKSKSGKVPVTTTGVLAGTAAALATGLVFYGVVTSPSDGNTEFSDLGARNNYAYTSGSGMDNTVQDNLVSARGVNLVDRENLMAEQRDKIAADQIQWAQNPQVPSGGMEAYQFSNGGISLAGNSGVNDTAGMDVMSNVPGLSGLVQQAKDAVANAQNAQGGAAGSQAGNGAKEGEQKAAFQRVDMKFGKGAGSALGATTMKAGGNTESSTWNAGSKDAAQAMNVLSSAMDKLNGLDKMEGASLASNLDMNNKARFGSALDSRSIGNNGRMDLKAVNDLDYARRSAKQLAQSQFLGSSDLGKPFLGGDKLGGVVIGGKLLKANLGEGGTDDQKFKKGMKNVRNRLNELGNTVRNRSKDANSLKKKLWIIFGIVTALAIAIPWLKTLPSFFGINWGMLALLVGLAAVAKLGTSIYSFAKQWDFKGMAVTATLVGAAMTAGLLLSFFLSQGNAVQKGVEQVTGGPGA